jgi:GTP cyclohydrolase II
MAPPDSLPAKGDGFPVSFVAETHLPTDKGSFRVRAYRDHVDGTEPVAIIVGDVRGRTEVPVRVHDECFTSEVLGSLKCDCKDQLGFAMELIQRRGCGVVIYLRQEGRGIGLANKIAAYALQEEGHDTVDANRILGLPDDARRYDQAAAMLSELGVESVRLMTNNPRKVERLSSEGVTITGRIPVLIKANSHSAGYLAAKHARMGHQLDAAQYVAEIDEFEVAAG